MESSRQKVKAKRQRKRKARTQAESSPSSSSASSASSSDSEVVTPSKKALGVRISRPRDPSTPSTEEPSTAKGKNKKDKKLKDKKMKKKEEKSKKPDAAPEEPSSVSAPAPATATPATTSKDQTPFQAYYLRSLTTSFSDDLDALRSAPDFSTNSLPVLVNALVQGADLYSAEDQVRIMGGNAA